jgi:DNA-binding transcriptional MerR regulator
MARLLSIGELAERTGVAATALRYYDDLGLVRPAARASGRRRYAESAVAEVGVVLFLRDVGFTLGEVATLVKAGSRSTSRWKGLVDRKLAELDEQEQRLRVARTALEHASRCPAGHPSRCPRFWAIIEARSLGVPLEAGHAAMHTDDAQASPVTS